MAPKPVLLLNSGPELDGVFKSLEGNKPRFQWAKPDPVLQCVSSFQSSESSAARGELAFAQVRSALVEVNSHCRCRTGPLASAFLSLPRKSLHHRREARKHWRMRVANV
jgi:hypothetical protein